MNNKVLEYFDFDTIDDIDGVDVEETYANLWNTYEVGTILKYDKDTKKFSIDNGVDIAMCVCSPEKSPTGYSLWMSAEDVTGGAAGFPTIQFGGCGEPAPFKTECKHEPLSYYLPTKEKLEVSDPMPEDCDGMSNTAKLSKFNHYAAVKLAIEYNPANSNTTGKWYIPSIGELHAIDYKQIPDGFFTSGGVLWSSSVHDDKTVYIHSNTQARLCEYGMDGYAYLRPFLNLQ